MSQAVINPYQHEKEPEKVKTGEIFTSLQEARKERKALRQKGGKQNLYRLPDGTMVLGSKDDAKSHTTRGLKVILIKF